MTESPRGSGPDPYYNHPGYTDPAYASQTPYGPSYQAPAPTQRLPVNSPYTDDPYATGQFGAPPPGPPPPEEPKSPRWLWVLAAVAVLTVVGLVIALVIVNSSRQQTVMAPLPSAPEPSYTPAPPTTASRTPTVPVLPLPTLPESPRDTASPGPSTPGATESVVYDVAGNGRAINITYVDTGGVLQTEFNVVLPWSKQVELAEPAQSSASVSIINVGREVTCSVTVNGVQVQQRSGSGLTICAPTG